MVILREADGRREKVPPRSKREECKRTKHDSVFSKWEILIGPSDWKDHSLGKDGVERYRIHNLPIGCSCPGLYELGVAAIPTDEGHRSRKYASDIVAVYLGEADNVRTRLQHYGRTGSHLDRARLQHYGRTGSHLDHGSQSESLCPPGLFKEIFSKGYSIMFRWAPMTNKKEAEKMEDRLLEVFDYAWNRRGNGASRREDILRKLNNTVSSPVHTLIRNLQQWKQPTFGKTVGIKIHTVMPLDESGPSNDWEGFLFPQILKFVKYQPQSVQGYDSRYTDHNICGVAIGNGSVCRNRPILGRKRCVEHKGKRISGNSSVKIREIMATQGNSIACGVMLEDGSLCVEFPAHGRKRCELHKGRRAVETELVKAPEIRPLDRMGTTIRKSQPHSVQGIFNIDEEYDICGVVFGDGSVCRCKPVLGRKRCEQHKGQRITGTESSTSREVWDTKGTCNLEDSNICGAVTADGYACRRKPVSGRKRCETHKCQRDWTSLMTNREVSSAESMSSMCGVRLRNGSICMKSPVRGRKRCELHKGMRVT